LIETVITNFRESTIFRVGTLADSLKTH
jgi:hypothetical protein